MLKAGAVVERKDVERSAGRDDALIRVDGGELMKYALWTVQGLLAVLFLLVGGMKLILPAEELTAQFPFPSLFVRFLGIAEVLGALGLILPGLLRIRPGLTPLAAAGLVVIMIGAVVVTLMTMDAMLALFPLVVGLLAAFVAYGRWQIAPHRERGAEQATERPLTAR
jgi:hypothetical protein